MTTIESARPTEGQQAAPVSGYASLRHLLEEEGLFDRQPRYYAIQVGLAVAGVLRTWKSRKSDNSDMIT